MSDARNDGDSLARRYRASLAEKGGDLSRAWDRWLVEPEDAAARGEVRLIAHRLAGSAGRHGAVPATLAPVFRDREELAARIEAVLRRQRPQAAAQALEIGELRLDPASHRVTAAGLSLALGPTEFRLLHFLMTHPERVHSRNQLLDQVWGDHVFVEERTVDVHIRRLRAALEPSGLDSLIQTVRGSGYRFSTEVP